MKMSDGSATAQILDAGIARLLGKRCEESMWRAPKRGARTLFDDAVELGLISREGFLTRAGRSELAQFLQK
jgi:hypothetical protein